MIRSDFASILASLLDEDPSHTPAKSDDFPSDNLHFAYVVEPNFASQSEAYSSEANRIFSLDTDIFKLTEALAAEMKNSSYQRTYLGKRAYKTKSKNVFAHETPPWHQHKEWSSKETLAFTRLQSCILKLANPLSTTAEVPAITDTFRTSFTKLELKKVYRKLVLFSHPDRDTGDLSLFIQVKADYQTLMAFLEKIA